MYAICIEASHQRGMGHFFRALAIIKFLVQNNKPYILLVNENAEVSQILKEKKILFETVDLNDLNGDWESGFIKKYNISHWLNDRMDTDIRHAEKVKANSAVLVSFDDYGTGAKLLDYNIVVVPRQKKILQGKKILSGNKYLILNKEIDKYKNIRTQNKNTLISLGGSDTYGVTIKIVKILKKLNKAAEIVLGPSFKHTEELNSIITKDFNVKKNVPSLIAEFSGYDLAITGGGITPFEANASGLPCIIVANELWEIDNAMYLESVGSSKFAGYHEDINESVFAEKLNIKEMSYKGMTNIDTFAVERIFEEILK